jgi:hypothetical protein
VKKWYGDGVVFGNQCFNCLRKLLSLFIYNHIKRCVNVLIICCGCTSQSLLNDIKIRFRLENIIVL